MEIFSEFFKAVKCYIQHTIGWKVAHHTSQSTHNITHNTSELKMSPNFAELFEIYAESIKTLS